MAKKKTKAKPKAVAKRTVVARRVEPTKPVVVGKTKAPAPARLAFEPELFAVTIQKEKLEREWFFAGRAVLLPDLCVYEHTPLDAYESLMEAISSLHATAMEEGRPFPKHDDQQAPPPVPRGVIDLKKALLFYDEAKSAPNGVETGAVKDAHGWLLDAARTLVARVVLPPADQEEASRSEQRRIASLRGEPPPSFAEGDRP